ncbi:MAG: hypothetical protein WKG07_12940 [Hymenobacter sp.]
MADLSARRGRPVRLLVEPGRIVVADAGVLLMTVVSVKRRRPPVRRGGQHGRERGRRERLLPVAPGGRGGPAGRPAGRADGRVREHDPHRRLHRRNARLPDLRPGDVLALRDIGAYRYGGQPLPGPPRPAEVVVDGDAVHLTTRRNAGRPDGDAVDRAGRRRGGRQLRAPGRPGGVRLSPDSVCVRPTPMPLRRRLWPSCNTLWEYSRS